MSFPYEHYATLNGPLKTYYPAGQEDLAHQVQQEVGQAGKLLGTLLDQPLPELEILVAAASDWEFVPREDEEDEEGSGTMLPYWTDVTSPPTLVVPEQMDEIIGEATREKLSLLLYHELAHAFLENDPRPWPEESPLWADEWQLQFAAFWLFQQIHGQIEDITADLHQQFAELFEPEADGKTPVTVRGFDWYEDTTPEDYLEFVLLLEKFAIDLLARYDAALLLRFLERYRQDVPVLLSDEVTLMLAEALGPGGEEWLEELVYF
ncbi:MAG TPA: hypothetical protein VFV38_47530 [Ktedonobacteraceae bacterium]|nr:hypothetical protein [Ktedonobacteraceae bacterium]